MPASTLARFQRITPQQLRAFEDLSRLWATQQDLDKRSSELQQRQLSAQLEQQLQPLLTVPGGK